MLLIKQGHPREFPIISRIPMTKPLTRHPFSVFKIALKLTHGNVELHNFPGVDPRTPTSKGRERGSRREGGGREGRKGD